MVQVFAMSDEQDKKPTNHGDPVITQNPEASESGGGSSWAAPVLLVVGMLGAIVVLAIMPTQSSPPRVPPGAGTPVATYAPGIPTPTSFLPGGGALGVTAPCQRGIEIGKTVTALANAVRIRQSPGYIGKDAADTIGYLQMGDVATVIGGPARSDGLCWWNVQIIGFTGWSADQSTDGELLLVRSP